MTIAEIGALGEFIAAIAVVITLIYLAIQIKHTKVSLDANSHQALNDISIHLYTAAISDESLATALEKSNHSESVLTSVERYRCNGFWTAMIRNAENMHYQFEIGLLEEERIRASLEILRRLHERNSHFRELWKSVSPSCRDSFRIWAESEISG